MVCQWVSIVDLVSKMLYYQGFLLFPFKLNMISLPWIMNRWGKHGWKFKNSKILTFRNSNFETCRMPTKINNFKCVTNQKVRASPASLHCGPWPRRIYPSLVLVQPRKTRPYTTERLLMGRKESNQTNKLIRGFYNMPSSAFWGCLSMESQPQNPEFRINPENFHPW